MSGFGASSTNYRFDIEAIFPSMANFSTIFTISDSLFVVNGYIYFVGPDPSSLVSYSLYGIYASDVTTAGGLTFHCQDTPSENLTVIVTRMVI